MTASNLAPATAGRPAAPTRTPARRPRDVRPGGHPDPERLVRLVARTFVEVECGRRPFAHLEPLLARALSLRLAGTIVARRSGAVADPVAGVQLTSDGDRCDASVVLRRPGRWGALAIRLERRQGVWRVVELARPEDVGRQR